MSLTPVPPPACTSCCHVAHKGDCAGTGEDGKSCKCGVSTLPFADHHTTTAALGRIEGMLGTLASRVEYLITEVLQHHEAVRRVPVLEAAVASLTKQLAAHDEWERSRAAAGNGGGP